MARTSIAGEVLAVARQVARSSPDSEIGSDEGSHVETVVGLEYALDALPNQVRFGAVAGPGRSSESCRERLGELHRLDDAAHGPGITMSYYAPPSRRRPRSARS